MKIIPVMTEKSMKLSKIGGYTFWVPMTLNKFEIKNLINKIFTVHVISIKTLNFKPGTKKSAKGQKQKIKAAKKTIVFLKEGEKISLFEEEKKPKKKGKNAKAKKNIK